MIVECLMCRRFSKGTGCQYCAPGAPWKASPMHEHAVMVQWYFVVPPTNTTRVLVMQRRDGPFNADQVGGRGYYYVSIERLVDATWTHANGSSMGGYNSAEAAIAAAEGVWTDLTAKASR